MATSKKSSPIKWQISLSQDLSINKYFMQVIDCVLIVSLCVFVWLYINNNNNIEYHNYNVNHPLKQDRPS